MERGKEGEFEGDKEAETEREKGTGRNRQQNQRKGNIEGGWKGRRVKSEE